MSCYTIEAIKFGIYTYFRDCEIEKYEPSFTKSEAFDEVITNHSLQEVRTYFNYKNNELPTYQDIARYVHDICYFY